MSKHFTVTRDTGGRWVTVNSTTNKTTKSYKTKHEAVMAGRSIAKSGSTVVIHDSKGSINDVLVARSKAGAGKVLEARVKHRRSNTDVNIAIAKAMDKRRK